MCDIRDGPQGSERNEVQEDKHSLISLMCGRLKKRNKTNAWTNKLINDENQMVVAKEKVGWG